MGAEFSGPDFLQQRYTEHGVPPKVEHSWQRLEKRKKGQEVEIEEECLPEIKIRAYLERLDHAVGKRKDLVLAFLCDRLVIQPENVREEDLKRFILENVAERNGYSKKDLQDYIKRRVILGLFQEVYRQPFDDYRIPPEDKAAYISFFRQQQRESLERWLDYLTSPRTRQSFPPLFRYWVMEEVAKLGSYDRRRCDFNTRSRHTLAPWPPLYPEAVNLVFEEIKRRERGEPSALIFEDVEKRRALEDALEKGNFGRLYALAIENIRERIYSPENLMRIDGVWKVYAGPQSLTELMIDLEGCFSGWCLEESPQSALYYLERYSYLQIFYTPTKNGRWIPRVAVVNGGYGGIAEVRGIAEDQLLDPWIEPHILKITKDVPYFRQWLKRRDTIKRLAEIYDRFAKGEELTISDLNFIYGFEEKIPPVETIIGLPTEDWRLGRIKTNRDPRKDLAIIFGVPETAISLSPEEAFSGDIVYHHGNLEIDDKEPPAKMPNRVGGNLIFYSLRNFEQGETLGENLPTIIDGNLVFGYCLKRAGVVLLPKEVKGDVCFRLLERVERLVLPQIVGGSVFFDELKSVGELVLPEKVGGIISFGSSMPLSTVKELANQRPDLKFYKTRYGMITADKP